MSTLSVPNTFASSVTATGQQLDNNFSTVVAFINANVNKGSAWWDGTATGTLTGSQMSLSGNVSAVARVGAGTWSFALTTAFANTQYVVLAMAAPTAGIAHTQELASGRTTAGFVITAVDAATSAVDISFGILNIWGSVP